MLEWEQRKERRRGKKEVGYCKREKSTDQNWMHIIEVSPVEIMMKARSMRFEKLHGHRGSNLALISCEILEKPLSIDL